MDSAELELATVYVSKTETAHTRVQRPLNLLNQEKSNNNLNMI